MERLDSIVARVLANVSATMERKGVGAVEAPAQVPRREERRGESPGCGVGWGVATASRKRVGAQTHAREGRPGGRLEMK